MSDKKQLTFIGLGAMGLPMAKRLLQAGYPVKTALHRNKEMEEDLRKMGAVIEPGFPEAVKGSDIIFTILPADREMREVILDDEFLKALKPGAVLVEMTTASIEVMKEIADTLKKYQVEVLDSPVSGGVKGAVEGTLTFMTGGKAELLQKIRPELECMAGRIFHVGDVGMGKGIKAINQMLVGIHITAASQALAMAEEIGISPEDFYEVVSNSSGASKVLENNISKMKNHQYDGGFQTKHLIKDMNIALNQSQNQDLQLLKKVLEIYGEAPESMERKDFSVINKLFRKGQ